MCIDADDTGQLIALGTKDGWWVNVRFFKISQIIHSDTWNLETKYSRLNIQESKENAKPRSMDHQQIPCSTCNRQFRA